MVRENSWLSTAPFKIKTRCWCFYITVFLKETDCLQKMMDAIFISSCMLCLIKQRLWVERCFVYSVTGETSLSTSPTVPPAGRELICIYMPPQASLWDYCIHKQQNKNKNNNNFTTLICLAISMRAKVLRDPQYSQGLIDMAILTN